MPLFVRPSAGRRRVALRLEPFEDRVVPAVAVGANFRGATSANSPFTPPDTTGAVGPNHFVELLNGVYRVYTKAGTQVQASTDEQFWQNAGISTALTNEAVGDPRVIYDPLSGRWFAVDFTVRNGTAGNSILVGRSETSDPTGTWKAASYVGASGFFADFPTLGVDANGIYIATADFPTVGAPSVSVTSIPKADLLLSTPTVANRTTIQQSPGGNQVGFAVQGVTNFNTGQTTSTRANLVATHYNLFGRINLTRVTGTSGANATFGPTAALPVQGTSHPGLSRQPDGTQQIDGSDHRIGSMAYQVGDLIFLVHGISVNAGGTAVSSSTTSTNAIRITVLRESTGQVATEATYFDPNFDMTYPSLAINPQGDMVIGFTRSGSGAGGNLGAYAVYAQINMANPGAGITFGRQLELQPGLVNNFHKIGGSGERWGDYSATTLDPTNPTSFWTVQEFALGSTSWGTQISQVWVSPVATGVSSTVPNGTYGVGQVIPITVTFNDAVTVTGTPRLALNAGTGAVATYASGSGTNTLTFNYTVAAGHSTSDLDYASATALTLNGGTIRSSASSLDAILTLATPGTAGSLGANKNIVIATGTAAVTNVTSPTANGKYGVGVTIPITVSFNNTVDVTGTPRLALNTGGTATYSGGTGTNTLTFDYTVAAGQATADLDYASTGALTRNGGTIKDATTGNDAILTLPAPGTAGSLGANKDIVIDAVGPTVVSYRVLFGRKWYDLVGSSRFDVPWKVSAIQAVFDEPVTAGNVRSLTGVSAFRLTGLWTTTLTWRVRSITRGSFATGLVTSGVNALRDASGNPVTAFSHTLNVLYGDFNDDGVVNADDVAGIRDYLPGPYQPSPSYNLFADLSGDGLINLVDFGIARARRGARLP